MASKQQLLDRAVILAAHKRGDAPDNIATDADGTAEVFFPHAVRHVVATIAASGREVHEISVEHTLAIVTNQAVLPPEVIVNCLDRSTIPGVPMASYCKRYEDFERYRYSTQIKYYAVRGSTFFYSGADGNIKLFTPSMPVMPGDPTQAIPYSQRALDAVVEVLAQLLTGEVSLDALRTL